MAATKKAASDMSNENVLRSSHVPETAVLSVGGFVGSKVGHKITLALATTTTLNDTEVYTYFDDNVQLMVLTIIYTDSSRATLISVERTA